MTRKIQTVFKLYRRYEEDIWGDLYCRSLNYKLLLFMSFVVQKKLNVRGPTFKFHAGFDKIRRDLKRYSSKSFFYLEKQKIKRFYGNMTEQQFKQVANAVAYKRTRRHQAYSFLLGLERRLDTIIYRFNLANTIIDARKLVRKGYLLVNNKSVKTINYRINNSEILTFAKPTRILAIWRDKIYKLRRGQAHFFPFPSYFWISYKHLFFKFNPTNQKHKVFFPFTTKYTSFLSSYY